MVLVTDSTYQELAPKLRATLLSCDFLAIDFEFLGLDTSAISLHDTTEQRYALLRDGVMKYRPCQLGIAFFKQKTDSGGFRSDYYSFPLFQRFGDNTTCISASSLRFLRNHKFDFNQVFTNGVEYCTRNEYRKFAKALNKGNALSFVGKEIVMEVELLKVKLHEKIHQSEMQEILKSTEEPLQNLPLKLREGAEIRLKMPGKTVRSSVELAVIIHELSKAFPRFLFSSDEENRVLTVANLPKDCDSEENLKKLLLNCCEAFEGVSQLMEAALSMRKPIVGHNCLLDCMYLYHYFFFPLPEKYQSFKRKFHKLCPRVIDTKILAQEVRNEIGGITDLQRLGDFFGNEKSDALVPPALRGFCEPWLNPMEADGDTYHDAGFDAYITGEVFLKMAHIFIITRNRLPNDAIRFKRIVQYLAGSVQNRIPFQLLDAACCYLEGEDVDGFRPDILNIVRCDRRPIEEAQYRKQERTLEHLMATYQFDMELSENRTTIVLATNTAGSYAFLCEKFSNNGTLIPLDELEAGVKWTFEQRQTAWRSRKDNDAGVMNYVKRRWARRQVMRMEEALA